MRKASYYRFIACSHTVRGKRHHWRGRHGIAAATVCERAWTQFSTCKQKSDALNHFQARNGSALYLRFGEREEEEEKLCIFISFGTTLGFMVQDTPIFKFHLIIKCDP